MEEVDPDFSSISYRDALWLLVLVFAVLVVVMLPFINPPVDADKMEPPGSIVASIVWPEGNDDVDLWVDGPGEPLPIGFSNKGGLLWNLLRDDLGSNPDYTPLNYEHAFTRGMPAGEYRVNVDCFRCATLPLDVVLEVSLKSGAEGSSMTLIGSSTITLTRNKEEKTGLAFEIDGDGKVIPESLNALFKPLRNMGAK